MLESLPVDPVLLGAGLGGLLVVLGGAALWRRRRNAEDVEDLGVLDETDLLYDENGEPYLPDEVGAETAISELEGMDLSDEQAEPQVQAEATVADPIESTSMGDDSDDDPLTEVNVYLAYERYDQAEEMVRSTIAQHPDRHEYKLRLLEVFYAAKDLGNFESGARELQDAVGADSALFAEAKKMWQDMSPGRELFSVAESTVPQEPDVVFDVTGGASDAPVTVPASSSGGDEQSGALDFDLGFESDGSKSEAASGESSIDFDLGFDQATGAEAGGASSLDLDLTNIDAGNSSNLDFDVGGGSAAEAGVGSAGMDFDMSGMDESVGESREPSTETPLPEPVSGGGDALDFDLGGLDAGESIDAHAPPDASPDAIPESPATADVDDGEFDFDFDAISGESEGAESGAMSMDTEFTALDLDLDTTDAASSASQLSAMDIDIGDDLSAIEDDASSALGFDIGTDSVDASAGASPDDGLDFGLSLDDGEVSDDTVKLDLRTAILDNDFDEQPDTVKLQSPEMDAADSAISNLGMDLNLDAADSGGVSGGVDPAFEGLFDDDSAAASEDDMALSLDGSDLIPPTPPPSPDAEPDFPEIDLDFDAEKSQAGAASDEYEATQFSLSGSPSSESSNPGAGEGHTGRTLVLGGGLTGEVDEVQTKLDLAQAYIDMGDTDGAKGIIDEILGEGNAAQKQAAMGLLSKLASS
jgi:pilus assembly protein FimV